ncbi:MAG: 2,3-bisphosphoglycerate-independent phosphoglycerate mutase [Pseudomonadota bacterium]
MRKKPLTLLILDGWGNRVETTNNAIALADTPCWDHLMTSAQHTAIATSGESVGLPDGQMGNSEVGHMNIGAGRIVYQDYTRISKAVKESTLRSNMALKTQFEQLASQQKALHIIGLVSPGGVHSHEDHIIGAIEMAVACGVQSLYLHAILDGRDMPPQSAQPSLEKMEALFSKLGVGKIATLSGRYYAMDRDNRWDRVALAFNAIVHAHSENSAPNALEGLAVAYENQQTDEFIKPCVLKAYQNLGLQKDDGILFMNFRADRARQLSHALSDRVFDGFDRGAFSGTKNFVALTQYDTELDVEVAFPPQSLENTLGAVLEQHQLTQLRIAETEKYAHVTFFFNGGVEEPHINEHRELIPSPQVATYDLQPEMNAAKVADTIVEHIQQQHFDVIICNFANPDMVGHTGKLDATIKAIETIDTCLEQIIKATKEADGECLITADHGNAELMVCAETGQPHTSHTTGDVPFVYVGQRATIVNNQGKLSDIAPTILHLLNIPQPQEMTGTSILKLS